MTTFAILLLLGAASLSDASVHTASVTGPLSPFFSSTITAVIGRAGWYNCLDGTEVDTLYAIDAIPASVPSLRHEVSLWDQPGRETFRLVVGGVDLRALKNALVLAAEERSTVRAALRECEKYRFHPGGVLAEVRIVNAVGDTVRIYSGSIQPYRLPWTIEFDDRSIETYSIDLARLLMPLLPREGEWDEREEKVELLYAVAWYLGRESR